MPPRTRCEKARKKSFRKKKSSNEKIAPSCWRSCGARGRRWPAAGFRVAGAVHRASWRSCGARGRRWPAARFRVAGAVQRASWLPFAWQAQYTEPRQKELRRAWAPLARGWLSRGRRSTDSFLAAFGVAGAVHRASWRSCGAWAPLARGWLSRRLIITTHHGPTYHITTSHHNSSQLITPYHIPSHHSSTSHTSLITAPLLVTTNHSSTSNRSTSHHNLSQPNS